jgi:tetratricopeptide (TPR) repeat protein
MAIFLNPKESDNFFHMAAFKSDLGDFKGAIEDYTKAIDLNPTDTMALVMRAFNMQNSGDLKGACLDWSKAAEYGSKTASKIYNEECQ